jgi:hypothetical protein
MSNFRREDRYIVIKCSDMDKAPSDLRRSFLGQCRKLHDAMLTNGAPARSFLVIEKDCPEYEAAWQMIERRMTGAAPVVERQPVVLPSAQDDGAEGRGYNKALRDYAAAVEAAAVEAAGAPFTNDPRITK